MSLTLSAVAASAVDSQLRSTWEAYKANFSKAYSESEEPVRFQIFTANVAKAGHLNGQGLSWTAGLNAFSDQTPQEFQKHRLGFKPPSKLFGERVAHLGTHVYNGEPLDESVDWEAKGAVTPVKDQKTCGSCWAFSTTGSTEGAWQVASGHLVSLSEQQLVDCSKANDGCDGGAMDPGFEFLETAGACAEESYPYTAQAGSCKSSCDLAVPAGGVTGYKDVDIDDSKALMSALMTGPVSVAIEADQTSFQMYSGGVLKGTCGSKLDHGVLAVGYGTDNGLGYWKVKNSWGPSWGERGYFRLLRSDSLPDGECGVLKMSSYPVVDASVEPSPAPAPTPTPSPTPVPTPTPSPSPGPFACVFADSEEECEATSQNGQPCTWCQFGDIGGLCMDPDYNCDGPGKPVIV